MKNFLFFTVACLLFSVTSIAQDCQMFFPVDQGTEMEIKDFDKKGKLSGSSIQTIVNKEENDNNISLTVAHKSFDDKGKPLTEGEFKARCEDGIFYMDMRNMIDESTFAAYQDMEITVDANDMAFPGVMDIGAQLPDADIAISVGSGGMPVFKMTVFIKNRKVEGLETITTEAGSFECYKMSYDIETRMVVKVQAKAVQWIAKDVGMVRSESYNKNGKLQGYSELTSLKRF
ncbi:MAG: DUF3108 domain-containing protein [Bacteroidales bacterium]|nr:DUF3108 domain-containing protein [Bacteroidales bacterium]MCF8403447.1 DUF3108 domain-containing protein [Bacteroidales bacterium]